MFCPTRLCEVPEVGCRGMAVAPMNSRTRSSNGLLPSGSPYSSVFHYILEGVHRSQNRTIGTGTAAAAATDIGAVADDGAAGAARVCASSFQESMREGNQQDVQEQLNDLGTLSTSRESSGSGTLSRSRFCGGLSTFLCIVCITDL